MLDACWKELSIGSSRKKNQAGFIIEIYLV